MHAYMRARICVCVCDTLCVCVCVCACARVCVCVSRARTLALYVDDAVIGAAPEDLQEILRQLPNKLATAGLQMAGHKTQVWSPQGAQLRPFPSLQQLWEAQTEKRGLKIVGQAFGHDPLEGHAFGEASFVEDVLRQHLRELRRTVEAIRTLPAAAGAGQPGNQVAWSLLTNTLPSRVLHLLRTHPVGLTAEFCEELQAMLQEAVLSILDVPSLTAVQWEMAFVPPPGGGLGLQHLPTSRIVARASALMAACRHFPASEVLQEKVAAEREELIDRLLPLMCQHPAEILGDIRSPPPTAKCRKGVSQIMAVHSLTQTPPIAHRRGPHGGHSLAGKLETGGRRLRGPRGPKCQRCMDDCQTY